MKRFFTLILALCVLLACGTVAQAYEVDNARASLTLAGYNARLLSKAKGTVTVSFEVTSSKRATSLGIESITFYTSNGVKVSSVSGSTSNGLIQSNSSAHAGDYKYSLSSGKSYYAEVIVFAEAGGNYDSRTITTSTVTVR